MEQNIIRGFPPSPRRQQGEFTDSNSKGQDKTSGKHKVKQGVTWKDGPQQFGSEERKKNGQT